MTNAESVESSGDSLLAWQWRLYRDNHQDRRNLVIHLATWPLFVGGLAATLAAIPLGQWWLLAAGPFAMAFAIALQGRGHKLEASPPVPFRGPADVLKRIFAEQLITFPRYVLTGTAFRHMRASRAA